MHTETFFQVRPMPDFTSDCAGRPFLPPDERTPEVRLIRQMPGCGRAKEVATVADLTRLAGGIAHNFNNLLMGINGYVELMLLDPHRQHQDSLVCIKRKIFVASRHIAAFLQSSQAACHERGGLRQKTAAGQKPAGEPQHRFITDHGAKRQAQPAQAAVPIVERLLQWLNDIQDLVVLMKARAAGRPWDCEALKNIERLIAKGMEMIDAIGKWSRAGGLNPRPVRLDWLVREVMDTFGGVGTKIRRHYRFTQDLMEVMADPGQVEQGLQNLYLNAVDAMPEGGDLYMAADNVQSDGSHHLPQVRLTVTDTGMGMDQQTMQNIFDPFFSTKAASGRGLGLAAVQRMVRAHGGRIAVASMPGKGSTFTIFLPAIVHPVHGHQRMRAAG